MLPLSVVLLALVAAVLWGIEPVAQKWVLHHGIGIEGETYLFIAGFSLCLVWLIMVICNRKKIIADFSNPAMRDPRKLAMILMVSLLGFTALYITVKLIKHHPAPAITVITAVYPIFTLILAKIILHEKFNMQEVFGVLLATAGIMLIVRKTADHYRNVV